MRGEEEGEGLGGNVSNGEGADETLPACPSAARLLLCTPRAGDPCSRVLLGMRSWNRGFECIDTTYKVYKPSLGKAILLEGDEKEAIFMNKHVPSCSEDIRESVKGFLRSSLFPLIILPVKRCQQTP